MTLQLVYWIDRAKLGRRRLSEATGLTEMAVRLELDRLRDAGLVEIRRIGPRLTAAGAQRFRELQRCLVVLKPLELSTLRIAPHCVGAHVVDACLPAAWEARDTAVRAGAAGLLCLRRMAERWVFAHDHESIEEKNRADAEVLEVAFGGANEGANLLLSYGTTERGASDGLWALLAEILRIES
jgi:DNA-binding transcriptional ArsR family regulator